MCIVHAETAGSSSIYRNVKNTYIYTKAIDDLFFFFFLCHCLAHSIERWTITSWRRWARTFSPGWAIYAPWSCPIIRSCVTVTWSGSRERWKLSPDSGRTRAAPRRHIWKDRTSWIYRWALSLSLSLILWISVTADSTYGPLPFFILLFSPFYARAFHQSINSAMRRSTVWYVVVTVFPHSAHFEREPPFRVHHFQLGWFPFSCLFPAWCAKQRRKKNSLSAPKDSCAIKYNSLKPASRVIYI